MTTQSSIVPVVFDRSAWTKAMNTINDEDLEFFAGIFEVSVDTLKNWRRGNYNAQFLYPRMSNFIDICNHMDLNPQTFFILDESEK